MAVEVVCGDPFPSFSVISRNMDTNAPSSFHDEPFPVQITTPATPSPIFVTKKASQAAERITKRYHRSVPSPPRRERASTMSDGEQDKKRNKLGYQRISIACGII